MDSPNLQGNYLRRGERGFIHMAITAVLFAMWNEAQMGNPSGHTRIFKCRMQNSGPANKKTPVLFAN